MRRPLHRLRQPLHRFPLLLLYESVDLLFRVLSFAMPYSNYLKQRVLVHHDYGLSPRAIADALAGEGMSATRQGIAKLLARYIQQNWFARKSGGERSPGGSLAHRPGQTNADGRRNYSGPTLRHPSSKRLRTISVYHLA